MPTLNSIFVIIAIIGLHIIGEKLSEHAKKYQMKISSLGAGLLVGIFFLEVLPQLTVGREYLGDSIYILLFLGFVTIHVLEKFIYQHADWEDIEWNRIHFEAGGFAAYGLIMGFIVVLFFETYGNLAFFLLFPLYIRTFAVAVYFRDILEDIGRGLKRIILMFPLFGAIIANLLVDTETHLYIIFSLVMGFFLYIVIRDMIPRGRSGKPFYFLLGSLVSILTFSAASII